MMSPVLLLILLAGLSEAAGRLLPLVSRRPGMSRPVAAGLLLAGALAESAVIALWPVTASALAEHLRPAAEPDFGRITWTAELVAPLILTGILAFPMLGPPLHLLLLGGVSASLAGPLAAASGLGWSAAAACLAVTGVALAAVVESVRHLVADFIAANTPEATA